MTWLAWRQFRTQAAAAALALALLGAFLLLTGPGLADDYADGLAVCGDECRDFQDGFVVDHQAYVLLSVALVLLVPALVGLFWGAPLVARELDAGTHRLVWTQSVTRGRWLLAKLAVVGLGTAALAGVVVWGVDWWSDPLDAASLPDPRLPWGLTFASRGVVPIAYALFAFVLGVAVGMLVRRALPAMAITLAAFAVVQVAVPTLVRPHLAPVVTRVDVVTESKLGGGGVSVATDTAVRLDVQSPEAGAWLLSSTTVDSSGRSVETVPVSPFTTDGCDPVKGVDSCLAVIERLGYRQESRLHPASQFWRLQWTETGLYVVLSGGLVALSFGWLRRRVA